jgi:hypothetical protein
MPLNANAIITVQQLADHLDNSSPVAAETTRYELWINSVSSMVERYLDRKLQQASIVEYHDGRSNDRVVLREWPVASIDELAFDYDSEFSDPNDIQPTDDYELMNNELVYLNGTLPKGKRNVRVTYTAGYAEIPADIQLATILACEWFETLRSNGDLGRTNLAKQDENVSILQTLPPIITDMLDPYRRVEIPLSTIPVLNR